MDFYQILMKQNKDGTVEMYPNFVVCRSKDLMVRGRSFYAIWDEEAGLWSRDEYDVQRLVDEDLRRDAEKLGGGVGIKVKYLRSFENGLWKQFKQYLLSLDDNSHTLDSKITFANTPVKKTDYVSRRLPYDLEEGEIPAWNELIGTLYSVEERAKIEWAIGSIIAGDSKKIQKFLVFYGPAGTGKSTVLNIIQLLFAGYCAAFDGKALGSSSNAFATEAFRSNPLVAIQHDGDLSRIEDNARLNSIISHEDMQMNEKYKPTYTARADAMLFVGTNQPVKISDAKSGLLRRLIDVNPTGVKISPKRYQTLISQIDFELGAIANHCLQVYLAMGKNYYNTYRPLEMMFQTNVIFNFVEAHFDIFKVQEGVSLKQAYTLFKEYCAESGIDKPLPQYKFRDELKNYFDDFKDRGTIDGVEVRSLFAGFNAQHFKSPVDVDDPGTFSLVMEETTSLLDERFTDQPAQEATADGVPAQKWSKVKTRLSDLDTSKLHFVKIPGGHIVIDFDLKGQNGHKALERNLEAASAWPATYAELSQSGQGVHLHYDYVGDTETLATHYSEGIEIKTFRGDAALRRKVSKCNAIPVSKISSGIPQKKTEKMLKAKTIQSEKGLRELIERNLRKEIHPGTKPSVDFIAKVLDDAYESGIQYDVSDLRTRILAFAINSSNQSGTCVKTVQAMKFKSEGEIESDGDADAADDRIVIFDVEVYPNLFVICWKFVGSDTVVRMVNPKPHEVEELFKLKLVGFYNRRYDNHILYAASMGYTPEKLFALSQRLIEDKSKSAPFPAAYSLSYADIWDFSSIKQGLKKFEIDLGVYHMELDLPWDEPVDEKDWSRVVEYCANDVRATEAVFEDRAGDFTARQILAELSGLAVNDTTQKHAARIIFGEDRDPQRHFVYTDLSNEFPGYVFEGGKSSYKGENPGEGGYVYAEPGIHSNVALLDVVSMHPTTIDVLNLFGKYTSRYTDLMKVRRAIKRGDFETARGMFDGRLKPYLKNEDGADALAYALKIVINIVYGLTSAKFDNPFRDNRNVDNIVAKRGALFMIDLKNDLHKDGKSVVHIKTDSVKIPNADEETIGFVTTMGSMYGYEFEHETTYDKLCLVNDAVYVARKGDKWTAVGAQFQHPYVFKSLFSGEEVEFDDLCESRTVMQGTMYLDKEDLNDEDRDYRRMRHLGRAGRFVPVVQGGGTLYRVKEDRYYAVTGTKGYKWIEAELAKTMPDLEIDMSYFEKLKADAVKAISAFGSFEEFTRR